MAQADNQDLRCAAASKLIYEEKPSKNTPFVNIDKQLEKFGMSLFVDEIPTQDRIDFVLADNGIIETRQLHELSLSFAADVFYDFVSKKPIIVFAGTDVTCIEDINTDILNALSEMTPYYSAAFSLGHDMHENNGIDVGKFVITGHSLGGGLATACALSAYSDSEPLRAFTFNAASISDSVCAGYASENGNQYVATNRTNVSSFVDAYIVRGEIVDQFQSDPLYHQRALGNIIEIGSPRLFFEDQLRAHLIDTVISELERCHSIDD